MSLLSKIASVLSSTKHITYPLGGVIMFNAGVYAYMWHGLNPTGEAQKSHEDRKQQLSKLDQCSIKYDDAIRHNQPQHVRNNIVREIEQILEETNSNSHYSNDPSFVQAMGRLRTNI